MELYLQHFTNNQRNRYAIIKVGGAVLEDDLDELIENLAFLQRVGLVPIVLHGAGPQLNKLLEEAKIEPEYIEGIRVTDGNTLKLVKRVFAEMNLRIVEGLEKKGIRAKPIQSGVFTGEYLDFEKYKYVGRIVDVDMTMIESAISSGAMPILSSISEDIDGQFLNVNADVAAGMLARVMEPLKVIYLNDSGGMINKDTNTIIPEINLDVEFEEYLKLPWVKYGTKLKLVQIKELLDYLPRSSTVSITNAKNMKKELFTISGAGTLIRRGFKLNCKIGIKDMDLDRVRELLNSNDEQVKRGDISIARYLQTFKGDERVYFDDLYQVLAVLTELPINTKVEDVKFIEKLVFNKQAELVGLLDNLWDKINFENPKLIWYIKNDELESNLNWHFDRSSGSFTLNNGKLFWKGLEFSEIEPIILSFKEYKIKDYSGVDRMNLKISKNNIHSDSNNLNSNLNNLIKSKSYSTYTNSSKEKQLNIGLIGARGYTGQELIKLLNVHPIFHLTHISSRELANQQLDSYTKSKLNYKLITPESLNAYSDVDAWILALPNRLAHKYVDPLPHDKTILDLSADYRFDSNWYYGLSELYPIDKTTSRPPHHTRISNPGCYATAAQLGLFPILQAYRDEILTPSLFGVSGYSGAGTTPSKYNDPVNLKDNLIPYQLTNHIHENEISHHLSKKVHFTPHVASFFRGIIMTIHIPFKSKAPISEEDVLSLYIEFYKENTNILVSKEVPNLKNNQSEHGVRIGGFKISDDKTHLVIVATIDNLLKGAATQVIQNLNLSFGLESLVGVPGWKE